MTAQLNEKLTEILTEDEMLEIRAQVKAEILAEMDTDVTHVRYELTEKQAAILADPVLNFQRKTATEIAEAATQQAFRNLCKSRMDKAIREKDRAFRAGNDRKVVDWEAEYQRANKYYTTL